MASTGVLYTQNSMQPPRKKFSRVVSVNNEGHRIGPLHPIRNPGKVWFTNPCTAKFQYGGAPSCWEIINGFSAITCRRT